MLSAERLWEEFESMSAYARTLEKELETHPMKSTHLLLCEDNQNARAIIRAALTVDSVLRAVELWYGCIHIHSYAPASVLLEELRDAGVVWDRVYGRHENDDVGLTDMTTQP